MRFPDRVHRNSVPRHVESPDVPGASPPSGAGVAELQATRRQHPARHALVTLP